METEAISTNKTTNEKIKVDKNADTVVYGTIRTADTNNPVAEAITIKDSKYIYVGDETGVKSYIKSDVTEVIDHRGKGMVMPSCTDGHSHYNMVFGLNLRFNYTAPFIFMVVYPLTFSKKENLYGDQ